MSGEKGTMANCQYCHKEIQKDDDFVLVGKYPSFWNAWKPFGTKWTYPEEFGMIYHKSCFLEMMKNEGVKPCSTEGSSQAKED
jgi:hypothetical protein